MNTHDSLNNLQTPEFTAFIHDILLRYSGMKETSVSQVLGQHIQLFRKIFVSPTVNIIDNYELMEMLGDTTVNKAIVQYLYIRFQTFFDGLKTRKGMYSAKAILSRLKSTYQSKKFLQGLASFLRFDIYAKNIPTKFQHFSSDKIPDNVLEDVFEAFCGALEYSVNKEFAMCGNPVAQTFIWNLLDIKLADLTVDQFTKESIYDYKSLINNLVAQNGFQIQYIDYDVELDAGKPIVFTEPYSQVPYDLQTILNTATNLRARHLSQVEIKSGNTMFFSDVIYGARKANAENQAAKQLYESGRIDAYKGRNQVVE